MSQRLLAGYLRQPYEFFLSRNSADLSKSMLSEVDELTENVFQPAIHLIAYGLTAMVLVSLLVLVDPWIAVGVTSVVAGSYTVMYLGVRGVLGRIGGARADANRERFTAASEVLGGIKDIKVLGREDLYLSRFAGPSEQFSRYRATNAVLALVPKHLIEAVGFGGVLALAVFLMATRGDLAETLPILGLYAFAGYRLLPSAQQVFASLARLRFGKGAVDAVHADLKNVPPPGVRASGLPPLRKASSRHPTVRLQQRIELEAVSYSYPKADKAALNCVDLVIPKNSSLGIVGSTGSGKTTLVDVLLGLLFPTQGRVLIDGEPLGPSNVRGWQGAIGYVPQQIYLTDASVAENIALGVEADAVDREQVEVTAKIAQAHEFVCRLSRGYETVVGERGVRLSGGEKQRLGLARALYHDPQVLILDEATSALDLRTESRVMEAISELRSEKTMVVIAHRLSTVEMCDQILVLEDGQGKGLGRFRELSRNNPAFQRVTAS